MHQNVSNSYQSGRVLPSVHTRPVSNSMASARPLSNHPPRVHFQPQQHAISTHQNNQQAYPIHMDHPAQNFTYQQQHQFSPHQPKLPIKNHMSPGNNFIIKHQQFHKETDLRPGNQGSTSPNNPHQIPISPTRRMDLSPNDSPHSTIDSKKGRSRTSSQSTPSKSVFAIKRSDDSPVTLQGWLFKQGSDGLMLWKKRWFVLSEFCLFYYKGPEEERCSGSILLPSYKISPVVKEDGVYRKFSFKAEHQNMRTYFFAAETKESMGQWMNALSLATICQQEQNLKLSPKSNSTPHVSPGQIFQPQRPQLQPQHPSIVQHHHPLAVHQMYSPSGDAYQYHPKNRPDERMDDEEDNNFSGRQPLYANAPPKPRRLNTSRERDSPSPERLVYQVNNDESSMVTAMYQQPHSGVHRAHVIDENTPQSYRQRPQQERRTPEVYGRASNFNPYHHQQLHFIPPQHQLSKPFNDVNTFPNMYYPNQDGSTPQTQPRFNPKGHTDVNLSFNSPNYLPMLPNPLHYQQHPQPPQIFFNKAPVENTQMDRHADRIPRPHSADFLEYEKQYEPNRTEEMAPYRGQSVNNTRHPNKIQHNQPPRPKSSIDQRIPRDVHHQNDEANFVRLYPTTPQPHRSSMIHNPISQHQIQHLNHANRNQNLIPQTPRPPPPPTANLRHSIKDNQNNVDSYTIFIENTNEEIERYFPTPSPRKATTATMTYQNVPNSNSRGRPQTRLESVTPNHLRMNEAGSSNKLTANHDSPGEFRRSASARMHRNKHNHIESFDQKQFLYEESKKKEQQEESMKRLLEWKQRMLQSPLTRKSSRNASRTQTPTNSSSPVPSLGNDNIFRQKVQQGLDQGGENATRYASAPQTLNENPGVSRKGSGASRSSRSRSSPWVSNQKAGSSSEEDDSDLKRHRKRSKSRQSNKSASFDKTPDGSDNSNIERSMGDGREEESQNQVPLDTSWKRKAIGPDDCYNDDFSYGQMNFVHEDPLFHQQYGRMLDLRYRVQREQQQGTTDQHQMRREKTWHGDKYQEFQNLVKSGKERDFVSEAERKSEKVFKSPSKNLDDVKSKRESPPKNVVQNRLKQFEGSSSQAELVQSSATTPAHFKSPQAKISASKLSGDSAEKADENKRLSQRDTTQKLRNFALKTDSLKEEISENESKKFLELLSDFERRTKELKVQEEDDQRSGLKHLSDSRVERRVFSDTETMLYDSSSDEDDDDDSYNGLKNFKKLEDKNPTNQAPAPPLPKRLSDTDSHYVPMALGDRKSSMSESPYLVMTPPKIAAKKLSGNLLNSSPRASMTNSSTSGSIRSLHSRTPSQTLVIEQMQKEIVAGILSEECYVKMNERPRNSTSSEPWERPESPRYCEIEDPKPRASESEAGSISSVPSHYEYLYQASTAPAQHYESVYQEIPEELDLKRPIDRLPDILGNTPPVDAQTSSLSDVEEEEVVSMTTPRPMMYDSDTFRPASFYLNNSAPSSMGARSKNQINNSDLHKSSLTKKSKSQSIDSIKSTSSKGKESKAKTYKPLTGLPPDKINLMYRSVYDNETSSYSDTDQRTSAASSGSLNNDTDGSYVNYNVSDLGSIASEKANDTPTPGFRLETPSRTDFSYENESGVSRSRSLEGLLGDGPPGPRDTVQVMLSGPAKTPVMHITSPSPTASYRSTPLPARGREPPPPPTNITNDLKQHPWYPREDENDVDEEVRWRESLRRASAEHKARSYSACADPITDQSAFVARQNFLARGLPDMAKNGEIHSGRLTQNNFPSLQNLKEIPSEVQTFPQSGRQSVAAIYMNVNANNLSESNFLSASQTTIPMSSSQNFSNEWNTSESQGEIGQKTDSMVVKAGSFSYSDKDQPSHSTNLFDLTAQDLLGKNHEELLFILINLRRQSSTLNEMISSSSLELQHLMTVRDERENQQQKQMFIQAIFDHVKELEGKLSRAQPIINLVENMVKLGSLYKKPEVEKTTEEIVRFGNLKEQQAIVEELDKISGQLQVSKKKLNEVSNQHVHWEKDILILRQQLQSSASRDMLYGLGLSSETLSIESELFYVHHQANELDQRKAFLNKEIESLTQKQEMLFSEIRPSPTGVSGAEPIPSKKKIWMTGWVETDLDSMVSVDRGAEVEFHHKISGNLGSQYVNTFDEEDEHNYENFKQLLGSNGYEDDVQTVHSEGVRSEMEPPPLPLAKRPYSHIDGGNSAELMENLTLGDISEADDRVKKFFGILPKDSNIKEIKTVRMVKRDSRERSISKVGFNYDDDEQCEESFPRGEPPPHPLPRGNYQNLHDFLTPKNDDLGYEIVQRSTVGRIKYAEDDGDEVENVAQPKSLPKTNFKLGEYYRRKYSKDSEKSSSHISAHERLFGSSRDPSLSPPSSPEKSFSSGRLNTIGQVASPIFKSAAARAIIQEMGKNWSGQGKKKDKKRSLTISGSHPAVTEALNNFQHKMLRGSGRSHDDLDLEQVLRPRGLNTPDLIQSAMDKNDTNATIDNLFGAPKKILIPERYVPESDFENHTPEERKVRLKKVDSIRRMLAGQPSASTGEPSQEGKNGTNTEERKQREHFLELNHLIAKQAMEKTRRVAGKSHSHRTETE